MDANVFYDDGTVKVTRNMFEVPGTQFPIRNLGSVKTRTLPPNRKGPIICIVVGVLLIAAAGLGLIGIGLGIWWWMSQKNAYLILVMSGGKEERAYSSLDSDTILKIQSAINQALALN